MTKYRGGPLGTVQVEITTVRGQTVTMTYTPPPGPPVGFDPLSPGIVTVEFAGGTTRSFNADTGQWLTVTTKERNGKWRLPRTHRRQEEHS